MLYIIYFNRIDVSKGIDVNKISVSKECDICHYWYFLNYSFKFQPNVCNRCHDLFMMSMNFSDVANLNIKGSDYCCIISLFDQKKRNILKHKNLLSHIRMSKEVLTFSDIEIEKNKFYCNKTSILLKDVDIEKVLVSNKIPFGEKNYKYFIGYLYNDNKV